MLNKEHSKQRKALRRLHQKQLAVLREHQRSERVKDYDIEDSLTLADLIDELRSDVVKNKMWLRKIGHFGERV